jgi:hypothetical protein
MKAIFGFLICCCMFGYFSCSLIETTIESSNQVSNILSLLGQLTNETSGTNAINHLSSLLNMSPSNLANILTGLFKPQTKFSPIELIKNILDLIAFIMLWTWILTLASIQLFIQKICFILNHYHINFRFCNIHGF